MAQSIPAVTLSVRISPKMRHQLNELADATGRTKSYLAAEAIEHYLAMQAWQVQAIESAVKKADSQSACFVSHDEVANWVASWDSDSEQEPPV